MAGSALTDDRILIVEQPGSWGRDALADSNLDPAIVAEAGAGARVMLARHCDRTRPLPRRHWWSLQSGDDGIVAASGTAAWDQPLAEEVWPAAAARVVPTVFLCTNGRRDACCAEFGRSLTRRFPHNVGLWEISHLGGHRFAPTALMLPLGLMLGRLDDESLTHALAGEPPPVAHLRGRIGRSPQRQTAEIAVAARSGAPIGAMHSHQIAADVVEVASPTRAGQPWDWFQVRLEHVSGPSQPKSCGADPQPATWWVEAGS
jgi:hypothetical protein